MSGFFRTSKQALQQRIWKRRRVVRIEQSGLGIERLANPDSLTPP